MHCTLLWGLPSAHVARLVALEACTVLYCMLLYSTVLYYDVLYCILLLWGALFSPCPSLWALGPCTVIYCTVLYFTTVVCCTLLLWSSQPHATPKYQISWESVLWLQAFKEFPGIQRVNWLIMLITQIAQSATFSNQAKSPLLSPEMIFW